MTHYTKQRGRPGIWTPAHTDELRRLRRKHPSASAVQLGEKLGFSGVTIGKRLRELELSPNPIGRPKGHAQGSPHAARNVEMQALHSAGTPVKTLAKEFGLSENRIFQILQTDWNGKV